MNNDTTLHTFFLVVHYIHLLVVLYIHLIVVFTVRFVSNRVSLYRTLLDIDN